MGPEASITYGDVSVETDKEKQREQHTHSTAAREEHTHEVGWDPELLSLFASSPRCLHALSTLCAMGDAGDPNLADQITYRATKILSWLVCAGALSTTNGQPGA